MIFRLKKKSQEKEWVVFTLIMTGVVRIPFEVGGGCLEFLQEFAGIVGILSAANRLVRFFQEQPGLLRIPSAEDRVGQSSFRCRGIDEISFESRQDWTEFHLEWLGLVRIPSGVDGIPSGEFAIGLNDFRSGRDWSEFHWKWVRLVVIPSGAERLVRIPLGSKKI